MKFGQERQIPVLAFAAVVLSVGWPVAAHGQAADSAWNAGDLERAAELYRARLAEDSTDVRALHRLGLIRAWNEDFESSLTLFDRLLRLDPENWQAVRDRGRVLGWSGSLQEALSALDRALEHRPEDLIALRAHAQFARRAGRLEAAREDYGRIAALVENPVEARLQQARFLSWSDELGKAEAIYRGILQRDSSSVRALTGLARVSGWNGELARSEELWRRARRAAPGDVEVLLGLARTLRWQGRLAAARKVLERAEETAPEDPGVPQERRWLEARLSPYAAPGVAYERDTDGNRIWTSRLDAGIHVSPRVRLSFSAHWRRARTTLPSPELELESGGGDMGLAIQLEPGWEIAAGAGLVDREGAARSEIPTWRARVSSPRRTPFTATLGYRREAFDYTARMIEVGVERDEIGTTFLFRPNRAWHVRGTVSAARYRGTRDNDRLGGSLSVDHRLSRHWSIGLGGRSFGFEQSLNDGYFDPGFYLLGEGFLRWTVRPGDWRFQLEAAPGIEQIEAGAEIDPTVRGQGEVAFSPAPGRQIVLSGIFASTGLQSFSTADANYRYGRVDLKLRWAF